MKENSLAAEIDAILPQTQCRQCGFSGCRPYAEAIAKARAQINQCPPGGEEGVRKLAQLLGVHPIPLNTAHGAFKPKELALIDEQACIGCTLCIQACPVDAIVGAAKQAHTVISAECTGCELCIDPCPVDCISMIPARAHSRRAEAGTSVLPDNPVYEDFELEKKKAADRARARYQFRLQRLEREKQEREERLAKKTEAITSVHVSSSAANLKKATIQAALERARAVRASTPDKTSEECSGSQPPGISS